MFQSGSEYESTNQRRKYLQSRKGKIDEYIIDDTLIKVVGSCEYIYGCRL